MVREPDPVEQIDGCGTPAKVVAPWRADEVPEARVGHGQVREHHPAPATRWLCTTLRP